MKNKKMLILFGILSCLIGTEASAFNIEVKNADGVTIYYNYINNGTELEVTYNIYCKDGNYSSSNYVGDVVIPEEVTYMNRTRRVTRIGSYAFKGCKRLTSVSIPGCVTAIGDDAFSYCYGLTSIAIPSEVTAIGEAAFAICEKLKSVHISDIEAWCKIAFKDNMSNPLHYANHLFLNGEEVRDLVIPSGVTSIRNWAFWNCIGLSSVTLSSTVTSIGYGAFQGCDISKVVSMIENPFSISSDTFSTNTLYNATLYVPQGTIDKYKTTGGWKKFLFIEEGNGDDETSTEQAKCEKPTISYRNGKLTFNSATEGASYQYSITDTDIKSGSAQEIQLSASYNISVYATKFGYTKSDIATATLCWIDAEPTTDGTLNDIDHIRANAILIQSNGGILNIQGTDDGTQINVYNINGIRVGSAVSRNGLTTINTALQSGNVAVVKIGMKTTKIIIR